MDAAATVLSKSERATLIRLLKKVGMPEVRGGP